jgi:hypothetical protein
MTDKEATNEHQEPEAAYVARCLLESTKGVRCDRPENHYPPCGESSDYEWDVVSWIAADKKREKEQE